MKGAHLVNVSSVHFQCFAQSFVHVEQPPTSPAMFKKFAHTSKVIGLGARERRFCACGSSCQTLVSVKQPKLLSLTCPPIIDDERGATPSPFSEVLVDMAE